MDLANSVEHFFKDSAEYGLLSYSKYKEEVSRKFAFKPKFMKYHFHFLIAGHWSGEGKQNLRNSFFY